MGNNNNRNQNILSDLITNENQNFVSEQFREDDMKASVKLTNHRNKNNNDSERFLSDQLEMLMWRQKLKQMKKRRRQKKQKRKKYSKIDFSENNTCSSELVTIDIPQMIDSSDQRLYNNKHGKFNGKCDGIQDQEYHHIKVISTASDTSPCIM